MTGRPPPLVSVLMPTFEQAAFLPGAVRSLLGQTLAHWELIIVDDGSEDDTPSAAAGFAGDARISYLRLPGNRGLGAALNEGLRRSSAPCVAYLPSDDRYDPGHLAALVDAAAGDVVLAWSGVRHHRSCASLAAPPGHPLQLVQVLHRRTGDRWVERHQLETDDLERLFWARLRARGPTASTGEVTCEWVDHPAQRHKAIRERFDGGLNVFRRRYRVTTPLRFHSTDGWPIDEDRLYARFRQRPPTPPAADGLRILLVGELAFNPERVLALEERGHRLFGLWTDDGLGDHTVGPLPFGHVTDIPHREWARRVRQLRPDVVYALLNWRAVPFAHQVLTAGLGLPFVWHFKEAPMRCQVRGTWPQLVDLVTRSDAQVFSSPEERDWFEHALPGRLDPRRVHVLDGDLPKADCFTDDTSPRLGDADGDVHTVAAGRPLGLDAGVIGRLAAAGIHVHLYGPVRGAG
ncbi:MAG: glycosyltransferase, partial [Actinomycetota bacterium]|nr:glycosyltransferase [Actinomycetota bacterium]